MGIGNLSLYGIPGDVNNSIPISSVYPGGRASSYIPPTATSLGMRNNFMGELSGAANDAVIGRIPGATMRAQNGGDVAPSANGGIMGKPASWWLMFFVVFLAFVFVSRRYGGGDGAPGFSNIRMTVYNGIFLTFFLVLMLNLLKVFAAKVKIPGVSELILAA